jgi:hypothetical protein
MRKQCIVSLMCEFNLTESHIVLNVVTLQHTNLLNFSSSLGLKMHTLILYEFLF